MTAPIIEAVNQITTPTYGVWRVPITAVDSRGTSRTFERPCVAIDRDPRLEGSPVLLSMTTLRDQRVHLSAWNRQWWFENTAAALALLTPRKFAKACRGHSHVFAAVTLPEPVWLPEEKPSGQQTPEIPQELSDYSDVLSPTKSGILPARKATDHAIDLIGGESPPHGPIYPLSQTELAELRKYLDENLRNGRVRPSTSPAGAPILFVPKKDGKLRLCVDYRGLNKVTVKNRYPLPLISEILDRISGAKFFSKIDVQDAYYRIRIKEGDEWKTAFRTRYGHYEYTVMPFGLTNAPATFQSYIHTALQGILDVFCIAYLDDILIFSADKQSHTQHIQQVLERMRSAELYANPAKCTFYQDQVEFLGYIISREGVSMDPRRVDTIASWKKPETYHDIQVFLGFCNFYRRFIKDYSKIALPLTALMKGSKNGKKPGRVDLSEKEEAAFRHLIDAFQSAPLLRHFDPERSIRLETDASAFAMAGILSQPSDEGQFHPVAFWSRKFQGPELNYGTPDQELFAIVHSFKHWRHYLEGSRYTVEVLSDHLNLQAFMRQPKLNGRQARWCMFLTPFDFVIKHRTGKSNPADAPSRRPDYEAEAQSRTEYLSPLQAKVVSQISIRARDLVGWKSQYEPDEMSVQEEFPWARHPHSVSVSAVKRRCEAADWAVWEELGCVRHLPRASIQAACRKEHVYAEAASTDLKGMIKYLQDEDPETQRRKKGEMQSRHTRNADWDVDPEGLVRYQGRLYIPRGEGLRRELLRLYHDDPLAGHFGRNRTEALLKRRFYWVNMQDDVASYVKGCTVCQGVTARRHKPYGQLQSLPQPDRPFQELSMDFITGLPPTRHNKEEVDAILVIVDRFTKYSLFFPVRSTINAAELAELFHAEIELKYGPPEGVVSDRGSLFTSKLWSKLAYLSNTKLRLSTAFHPQTDGQTERANQTLEHYLRCFIDEQQTNWPKLLATAMYACNNSYNATTGMTPAEVLLGYSPDFRIRVEDDTIVEGVPAARARIDKLQRLRERLKEQWRKAVESQAKHYNKKHKAMQFKCGDLVALSTKNLRLKTASRKLSPRFIGPFKVIQVVGTQAYRLRLPEQYDRLHDVFPVSLLEPWHQRDGAGDQPIMPSLEDEDEEWEIEEIRDEEVFEDEAYFLVKWKGWPSEFNQWIAEPDMGNAQTAIRKFRAAQKKRGRITKAQQRE